MSKSGKKRSEITLSERQVYCRLYETILSNFEIDNDALKQAVGIVRGNIDKNLERIRKHLDTQDKLIDVSGRRITAEGHFLYQTWHRGLKCFEDGENQIRTGQFRQKSRNVRICASEAVANYLLPHVAAHFFANCDENVELVIRPYSTRTVLEKMSGRGKRGRLDFAVIWDGHDVSHRGFEQQPLDCSQTIVHVLLHPSHPIAKKLWQYSATQNRSITIDELIRWPIVYPDLAQLVRLFKVHISNGAHARVFGLPAVANYVHTTKEAVGLFPGWPWLLNEIERSFHLVAAPLDVENNEMQLLAILPPGGEADLSNAARQFLNSTKATLIELSKVSDWHLAPLEKNLSNASPVGTDEPFYVYYITKGTFREPPAPKWGEGLLKIKKWTSGKIEGDLFLLLFGTEAKVTGRINKKRFICLEVNSKSGPDRCGTMLLSRALKNKSIKDAVMLTGIFSYEGNDSIPTASQVFLSTRQLAREQIFQLEQSNLSSFLLSEGDKDRMTT